MKTAADTYWPASSDGDGTGRRAGAATAVRAAFSVAASRRRPTDIVAAADIRGGMRWRRQRRRRASNSARNKSATLAAVALRLRAVPPGTCSST